MVNNLFFSNGEGCREKALNWFWFLINRLSGKKFEKNSL